MVVRVGGEPRTVSLLGWSICGLSFVVSRECLKLAEKTLCRCSKGTIDTVLLEK